MATSSSLKSELIPPPELAPPSIKHLPLAKRIEIWEQLVDENDALVCAGLKAKVGPNGDWQAAYREWYSRQREDHERALYAYAENLTRRGAANGK
jgi:hypothetical protein